MAISAGQMTPLEALGRYWGFDGFRLLQGEAVEAALGGRDCLLVLPTGGGAARAREGDGAAAGP
ncbi:MAG TPA: hypothetical protein VIR57_13100 [Chloroflexota bacterium]